MSFDGYGLQQQLLLLWQERQTGTLTSAVKGYEKKLFLKDGVVCFATSTDPDDKLPSVLVRQGRFTEEQFLAVESKFNDKISIGRNLIEMGLITQAELVEGAKEQIYTVFSSCMIAESGNAEFEAGPLPTGIVSLPLRYPRDLFRAILTMQDKIWVSRQFGNALSFVPTPTPDRPTIDFAKLDIGDFAQPTYKLIDGQLNFNHLTFESDVDEFTLLKFLYILRQLGYISIESDENEPEPEVESVLEDLGRAMEQSQQVERLRGEDFSGLSMDETIAMPALKTKGVQAVGSFDATTEISRDMLSRQPFDDSYEDEADEDPKVDAATYAFGGLDEGEEEGLDDLRDQTPDFFEGEIHRDQFDYASSGVIMPDRDEPDEDEMASVVLEDDGARRERRNRLMLLVAIGVLATGALLTLRPWIERQLGPTIDWTSTPPVQAKDEQPSAAKPSPAATESAALSEVEPQPTETLAAAPPQDQATATQEDPSVEQSPSKPAPVVTAAVQKPVEKPPLEPKPEPVASKTTDQATTGPLAFRSPVGEGWDPKTGRPRGQTQAPIQKIPEPSPPSPDLLQASTTSAPSKTQKPAPAPITSPAKQNKNSAPAASQVKTQKPTTQSVKAQTDAPAQPKPSLPTPQATKVVEKKPEVAPDTGKPTSPVNPPAPAAATIAPQARTPDHESEARRLLAEGRYAEAAALWGRHAASGKYTFALFLVCDLTNIEKAIQSAKGDPRLFILARERGSSSCYWVCWGNYDSRIQALKARSELPPGLADAQSEAKAVAALLK